MAPQDVAGFPAFTAVYAGSMGVAACSAELSSPLGRGELTDVKAKRWLHRRAL